MEQISTKNFKLVAPETALTAIANATSHNPVILDFDETLLLRNSTAEYINSFRPRLLGLILVIILKIIRPWKLLPHPLGGDKTKDWFLVVIPTILLPWTLLLWQRKAKKLAEEYSNTELISAVNQHGDYTCALKRRVSRHHNADAQIIVASLGFNFIINPILQHMPLRCDRLVGCRFWQGAGDRNKGKLVMMQEILSESEIKSAILVTDSEDDLPLLQVVGQPCFVLWLQAKYVDPFADFWLYAWMKKFKK